MDNNLAPTYQYMYGDYWVLWYASSNSYSAVDLQFKKNLDHYLKAESRTEFLERLNFSTKDSENLIETVQLYLEACNELNVTDENNSVPFDTSHRTIAKSYSYGKRRFQIYFDSELVQKTIHPSLAHLEVPYQVKSDVVFDIYLKDHQLYLFKNNTFVCQFPKRDYHKLQGKFITELLSFVHGKTELDWIGTFHGSTITDGTSSILFIGESGKGKSTLCAILASNGFGLVADDVSPLSSQTLGIHTNPAGISIKKGAFELLKPMVNHFEAVPEIHLNKFKGIVKYVPFEPPIQSHFPCYTIVLVNYKKDSDTVLEEITVSKVLQTLIPDSWLSADPKHAEQFLDWLKSVTFYKLTYSNTQSVVKEVNTLFKKQLPPKRQNSKQSN